MKKGEIDIRKQRQRQMHRITGYG